MNRRSAGIVLVIIAVIGLLALPLYAGLAWYNPAGYGCGIVCNIAGMIGQRQSGGNGQISFDEATSQFQNYVTTTGNKDLAVKEVMEFENNYYAIVYERSTGIGAFELLIAKTDGRGFRGMDGMMGSQRLVYPEPGPNMMWNTKYGMMMGMGSMMGARSGFISINPSASADMPVSAEQAKSYSMNYLNKQMPGATLEEPDRFYGYYTIHILKDDEIVGMLSVNGYTGDVWHHSWHGYFIQERDLA